MKTKLTDDELAEKLSNAATNIRAIVDVMAEYTDKALHGGIDCGWEREVFEASIARLCHICNVETPEERKL